MKAYKFYALTCCLTHRTICQDKRKKHCENVHIFNSSNAVDLRDPKTIQGEMEAIQFQSILAM